MLNGIQPAVITGGNTMKKTTLTIIASLIACSTLFSGTSWADGPGDHRWESHGNDQHQGRGPDHHDNYASHRMPEGHHGGDRFAWNGHDFRRGYPAPQAFRGPHYRVDDWRDRGLYEPPRGEHWAYIDGNYVLVAAATGIITAILLNNALN